MFCSSERQVTCSRHQLWKYKENVQLVILLVNAIRFHNVRLTPMRSGGKRIEIQAFQLFWTWPLSLKNPPPKKKKKTAFIEKLYTFYLYIRKTSKCPLRSSMSEKWLKNEDHYLNTILPFLYFFSVFDRHFLTVVAYLR